MARARLAEVFSIREANCPLCGTKGGYAGFSGFDCLKRGCKNHKGAVAPKYAYDEEGVRQAIYDWAGTHGFRTTVSGKGVVDGLVKHLRPVFDEYASGKSDEKDFWDACGHAIDYWCNDNGFHFDGNTKSDLHDEIDALRPDGE